MTPDEAAAVLGIAPDADEAEVDHAYRRLARELHPDRAIGAEASAVRAASDRFVQVIEAREVLLRGAAPRALGTGHPGERGGGGDDGDGPADGSGGSTGPRFRIVDERVMDAPAPAPRIPTSWALFGTWTLLLVVGALFALSGLPVWGPFDLWIRVCLLVAAAIATGLTGRPWVWRATLVLLAVNGIATVLATTIGGLLGLGFMLVASFGLAVQARLVRFPDQ